MGNKIRVDIPTDVDLLLDLGDNILKKHQNDGVASVLNIINMAEYESLLADAKQKHKDGGDFGRLKENAFEQRNFALGLLYFQNTFTENTVLYFVLAVRDLLKGAFRDELRQIGKWGFEVVENARGSYRIVIPYRNAEKLMRLAQNILKKHDTDAASSLLVSLDMAQMQVLLDKAVASQADAKRFPAKMTTANKVRNNLIGLGRKKDNFRKGTLLFYIYSVRDILLGKFRGREKILGDWGFNIIG